MRGIPIASAVTAIDATSFLRVFSTAQFTSLQKKKPSYLARKSFQNVTINGKKKGRESKPHDRHAIQHSKHLL